VIQPALLFAHTRTKLQLNTNGCSVQETAAGAKHFITVSNCFTDVAYGKFWAPPLLYRPAPWPATWWSA